MRRRSIVIVLAAVVAAGVSAPAAAGAGPSPGVMQGMPGIVVAGGAHVVTTPRRDGTTLVALIRDRDRKTLRSRALPGTLGVPLVTFSGLAEGTWAGGGRLVLASSIYDDRDRTTFVTLDTRTLTPLRTITLRGSFAFDALSPDGRRLYVAQFPNGLDGPLRYVVRSLRLGTGRLDPGSVVDKAEPDEPMAGVPVGRAWSDNRRSAYTLYVGVGSHAFVHALDTVGRRARCIDLPWDGAAQNGFERIRMAIRGGVLTLTQPGVGALARIDTRTFRLEVLRSPAPPQAG